MDTWSASSYINMKSFLFGVASFCAIYLWRKHTARITLPPGPFPLPVVGNIPFIGKDILVYLQQLAIKYGDVFTVYLGGEPTVVLNGYEVIKEALVKNGHLFSARPSNIQLFEEVFVDSGIIFNHSSWQEQRKFAHRVLRDLGMGKSVLQDKILEEIAMFHKELENQQGQSYDPGQLLHCAVSNIICSILFGTRFEYSDSEFQRVQDIMRLLVATAGASQAAVIFPWLQYIPGDMFGRQRYINTQAEMRNWISRLIDKHRSLIGGRKIAECFVDAYLEKIEEDQTTDGGSAVYTELNMVRSARDLLGGGSETTATTLKWAIAYMVHHPDIQDKVQNEIDSVIGKESIPVITDRARLPYTEACVLEILRFSDIAPLNLPHCTVDEVTLKGHTLPKGTNIITNLRSVHRDETWETPESFNPNHFLSSESEVMRREHLIPFSLGKRACLGESLARMELFLFFTSMLQKFTVLKPDDEPLPDLIGQLGLALAPKPYKVIFRKRVVN